MYEAMLVASVVIFIAVSIIYLRHPAASIFHPLTFYLAFHGLVFVIRPIFAWYYDFTSLYLAIGFTPTLWDKVRVLICTNISVVVFAAVSLWIGKDPISFKQDAADLAERTPLLKWFAPFAILSMLAGIYAIWWIIQFRLSGAVSTEVDTYTGSDKLTYTNGYFLGLGLVFGATTVYVAYLGRFRLWSLAPFGLFLVMRFATGSRGPAVVMAAVLGLLYIYDKREKWPKAALVVVATLLVLAFNATLNDRGLTLRTAFGLDTRNDYYSYTANIADDRKPLESMDFAMMESFEFAVSTIPQKTGSYDYFLSNSQLLVAPIPRTLWKEKPVGPPIRMFELYRYGKPLGITFTVPGMGWYYLGYAGVVIWTALFAYIYSYLYKKLVISRHSNLSIILYMTVLATSIIAFRDGLLYTILSQILFYFAPAAACFFILKLNAFPSAATMRMPNIEQSDSAKEIDPFLTPKARRHAVAGHLAAPSILNDETLEASPETPKGRRKSRMLAS